jgi:lipoate-protein ligase B
LGSRLTIRKPGLVPYAAAYDLQQSVATDVGAGAGPTLILLEHPPTYTLGVRGDPAHILVDAQRLQALGAEVVRSDRGGDVTFHGPGQIVGYPILDLRALQIGVADYVRGLEATLIAVVSRFGIVATRSTRNPGVWVGNAKIAAIGVRVSRGITTHGFALNVNTHLAWFDHIVPCGLADATVTSMQSLSGCDLMLTEVQDEIVRAFSKQFDLPFDVDPAALAEALA